MPRVICNLRFHLATKVLNRDWALPPFAVIITITQFSHHTKPKANAFITTLYHIFHPGTLEGPLAPSQSTQGHSLRICGTAVQGRPGASHPPSPNTPRNLELPRVVSITAQDICPKYTNMFIYYVHTVCPSLGYTHYCSHTHRERTFSLRFKKQRIHRRQKSQH